MLLSFVPVLPDHAYRLTALLVCAGPIRAEPGNRYYELAAGQDEVKYWESWSSLTSLYRHIYTSPTVAAVFRSETFAGLTKNMTLEGPFKASRLCCWQNAVCLL